MQKMEEKTIVNDNPNGYEGVFRFDPADGIYRVHFPGYPVVPGSVIVYAFIEAARLHLRIKASSLERFGFRKFVAPGEYPFRIRLRNNRVECLLFQGDKALVSGILKA